ncbi:MAG: phytanoyl-CoA dioxygenase family protein [Pseudomonadota bacterium]
MGIRPAYFAEENVNLSEFRELVERETSTSDAPSASKIISNVPVYDGVTLEPALDEKDKKRALMAEWANVLMHGPGVLVISGAATDMDAIDAATEAFEDIIAKEAEAGNGADHFAAAGANARIWNSLQKLCLKAPETFVHYHAMPLIDAVCEAWLGPGYQMTAQVNLVRPGGKAQQAHRDYHLGFQTAEICAQFPAHTHLLSPALTLQGGLAHVDIPVEAGPTKLLPFSQLYEAGYAAWRRDDFRDYFEENHVQLPMKKGDAIFFNPALFHAGGENRTNEIERLVNLFQVSSPFGRAMESIDRIGMAKAIYPSLLIAKTGGELTDAQTRAVVACCAEGYAFPTNLDTDPPAGGLAPQTHADILVRCIENGTNLEAFLREIDEAESKRQS